MEGHADDRRIRTIMKAVLAVLALCGGLTLLSSFAFDKRVEREGLVSLGRLPSDIDGFMERRDALSSTPEGSAALFVLALNLYAAEPELGLACLTAILANDPELIQVATPGAFRGYEPTPLARKRLGYLGAQAGIARSYIQGTGPADDYALPPVPWTVRLTRNAYSVQENGDIKVFVFSSGADSPRPLTLRRNERGVWKVYGFSSLVMGVRKAAAPVVDDL